MAENQTAYLEGAKAAIAGEPQTANPYNPKTPGEPYPLGSALAWNNGYWDTKNPDSPRD